MVISTSSGFGGGMQSYFGTLLTVKGHKRGGETEFSYATFLTDPSQNKKILKKGGLKKRASRGHDRWHDRYVVLRGPFMMIAHKEQSQGTKSKIFEVRGVQDGSVSNEFIVVTSEGEKLVFRSCSVEEKRSWKESVTIALADDKDSITSERFSCSSKMLHDLDDARSTSSGCSSVWDTNCLLGCQRDLRCSQRSSVIVLWSAAKQPLPSELTPALACDFVAEFSEKYGSLDYFICDCEKSLSGQLDYQTKKSVGDFRMDALLALLDISRSSRSQSATIVAFGCHEDMEGIEKELDARGVQLVLATWNGRVINVVHETCQSKSFLQRPGVECRRDTCGKEEEDNPQLVKAISAPADVSCRHRSASSCPLSQESPATPHGSNSNRSTSSGSSSPEAREDAALGLADISSLPTSLLAPAEQDKNAQDPPGEAVLKVGRYPLTLRRQSSAGPQPSSSSLHPGVELYWNDKLLLRGEELVTAGLVLANLLIVLLLVYYMYGS